MHLWRLAAVIECPAPRHQRPNLHSGYHGPVYVPRNSLGVPGSVSARPPKLLQINCRQDIPRNSTNREEYPQ